MESLLDWLILLLVALAVVLAGAIAGYFALRAVFLRLAEGMTRRIASRIDDVARVIGATPAGQVAAAATARIAAGYGTGFDAYATAERMSPEAARREFTESVERTARLMDAAVRLPILGRAGLDALFGLVPVVGDAASAMVSLNLIARSLRFGVPRDLVARMLANVVVDLLLGLLPVVGDLADIWFRANLRNVALLRQHLNQGHGHQPAVIDVEPVVIEAQVVEATPRA